MINFDLGHPRKKERKEDRKKVGLSSFPLVLSQWPFCHETVHRNFTLFDSRRKTFLASTERRKKERQKESWYVVLSTCIIIMTVLPWDSRLRFNAMLLSQKDFSWFPQKNFFWMPLSTNNTSFLWLFLLVHTHRTHRNVLATFQKVCRRFELWGILKNLSSL